MTVAGKVCVVTGASSGIGAAIAGELAAAGGRVCGVARRAEHLADVVGRLPGEGHRWVAADVSRPDGVAALGDHVRAWFGRCDVLVNNAGIGGGDPFSEAGLAGLRAVMDTNFFGAASCTAELLPLLAAAAPSHVVNIASIAGRIGVSGASAYSASKFALIGWSESVRAELAASGVAVAIVAPGPVPTPGWPHRRLVDHPVLRRAVATDRDVARAVLAVIRGDRAERYVPRWYYLIVLVRVVAPGLYRRLQDAALPGSRSR